MKTIHGQCPRYDSWWIKNDTKDSHLLNCMFQNAFTGNVAIDIYGGRDALVWQQCSEKLSVEYTIILPYNVI